MLAVSPHIIIESSYTMMPLYPKSAMPATFEESILISGITIQRRRIIPSRQLIEADI
jgi:hypothetical protein